MEDTKSIWEPFREVFRRPVYVSLFFIIALTLFLASLWFIRHQLLDFFAWPTKIKMFWFLIIDPSSTFTFTSLTLIIVLSILVAINITMTIFYVRRRIILHKRAGVGILGAIIGFLGVGCASCGSLVLSSIFGLSATAAFIGILPFRGLEFGILGVFILLISIYLLAKKIQNPLLCKINY